MIVVDTHVWLWASSDPRRLSSRARSRLRKARRIGVAAVSCWEVAMLVERRRISLDRGALEWMEQALHQPRAELLPLTPSVAVTSTQLGRSFPGDPADRQIVATALVHSATLVTRDTRISESGVVEVVW